VTDTPASPAPRGLWRPYQIYVVGLLLAVTVCNYLDRIVLGVLQEPIKIELGLTDAQLGLLTGPAFALFYRPASPNGSTARDSWPQPSRRGR